MLKRALFLICYHIPYSVLITKNWFENQLIQKKSFALAALLVFAFTKAFSVGEAGTYFNIFVPPCNEIGTRDVAIVVTAIDNNTVFNIQDTNEDGDSDDNATGILKTGQSYILYIRENGVNDDAPRAGEGSSKHDGDHFIITASKLVLVSSANVGEYQHNWLPATNKTSKGKKFFVYSNQVAISPNDVNVMAFEDNTTVSIRKISQTAKLGSGYTNVNLNHDSLIIQRTLSKGKDLIYYFQNGRNALKPGETYLITSNKEVTVQYGALFENERDGGGYVPSENGSSSGETFYFTIPFQDSTQQEVRVVSWNNNNNVVLERYAAGVWIPVKNFGTLNANKTAEWTGKVNFETYSSVFRVRGSSNKKISVVEGNWIETGNMLTSDLAMMVSPDNGTSAGKNFLAYMPIPARQDSTYNSLTQSLMPGRATHAYIFGNPNVTSHVTVKDVSTNGSIINKNITITRGAYADVMLDSLQWLSIYNGTGLASSGPQRPYLKITSDKDVAVMVTNFNDNWMLHYGSSMAQSFRISDDDCQGVRDAYSRDHVNSSCHISCQRMMVTNASLRQIVDDGLRVISARFIDSTINAEVPGTFVFDSTEQKTIVSFPVVSMLDSSHVYKIETIVTPTCYYTTGKKIQENDVLNIETFMVAVADTEEIAESSMGIAYHVDSATAPFTVSSTQAAIGENILFVATGNANSYAWDFGNGLTGYTDSVNVSYTSAGIYSVSLTTVNEWGCIARSSETVTVGNQPNSIENMTDEEIKIWSSGNEIFVNFYSYDVDAEIAVYNMLGQQIFSENNYRSNQFGTSISTSPQSYLVVVAKNKGRVFSRKIFLG